MIAPRPAAAGPARLRVLSLATLYPNPVTPNFGVFVERQTQAVCATGEVDLVLVNPIGLPPFPLGMHPRYRALTRLPRDEISGNLRILRPRFTLIPTIGARWNAASVARSVLPLARRLHAEARFDVVDAQFFHPDGAAAIRIGRALGLPVSIKARGADIMHWGHNPATAGQVLAAGRAASGLLAVSAGLADEMAALGMPRDRIAIHRTGLDKAIFRPLDRAACRRELGLPPGATVLVTVGALIARKGQKAAIAALRDLPEATLLVAGAGPDAASLQTFSNEIGVADRTRFLGAVPHGDLPRMLSAADVFVLPTASEGLANAWVEALACGTPVVTTPIPGAIELIDRPEMGRFAGRDGAEIAAAVRAILAAPPSPEAVSATVAGFSWEATAAALIAHWRRLATS